MMKSDNSLDTVRRNVSARIMGLLLPINFVMVAVNTIMVLVFARGDLYRIAVPGVALLFIIPAFIFYKKGDIDKAVWGFVLGVSIVIAGGLLYSGGIYAPIFMGLLVLAPLVSIVFSIRAGIVSLLLFLSAGGASIALSRCGLVVLRQPPPVYLLLVYAIWSINAMIISWFSVTTMMDALANKEKEKRIAEDAVKEREHARKELLKFKALVEQVRENIIITDRDNVVEYVNPDFERTTGYSGREVLGRKLDFLNSGEHEESFYSDIKETVVSGRAWRGQESIKTKNGRIVLQEVSVEKIVYDDDDIHYVSIRRDITKEVKMQEMMIQSEKMKAVGGLAAGIAHEINNPLTIILQLTQNIKRRMDPSLKKNIEAAAEANLDLKGLNNYMELRSITDYLDSIHEAGERAAGIVRSMLDFSRTGASNREMCSVNEILDEVIKIASLDYDMKKKYDIKNVVIEKNYSASGCRGMFTRAELVQVFLNIIKNSAQAMAESDSEGMIPKIVLSTMDKDDYVVIEISDNGPGIPEEKKDVIFEPFYTTKAPGEGTGLGLFIAYYIVTSHHNGNITVSGNGNRGTKFTIELKRDK